MLAVILGALGGVYLLRNAQAMSEKSSEEALRVAVARRDEVSSALQATKLAIVEERQRQAQELANLTSVLPKSGRTESTRRWSDFPCALRELSVAQVTKTCEVACRDSKCERATRLCQRLVECDAVLVSPDWVEPSPGLVDYSSSSARLVRDVEAARFADNSMDRMRRSRWWRDSVVEEKPRTYLVVSYGGCGSKMLAGWLSAQRKTLVKQVYHLHDSRPPDSELREMPPQKSKPSQQRDYRARRFPGGGKFRTDTKVVEDVDSFRVLFIYKDPVEALVSRFGYGHCVHLGGDCGDSQDTFPKLDAYAKAGIDRMGLVSFFENYATESKSRNFPIVLLNYHKLWDNLPAVMKALGLPKELAETFPERTETVRNDLTAAAERNQAHSEATRRLLDVMYEPILDRIRQLPAVSYS